MRTWFAPAAAAASTIVVAAGLLLLPARVLGPEHEAGGALRLPALTAAPDVRTIPRPRAAPQVPRPKASPVIQAAAPTLASVVTTVPSRPPALAPAPSRRVRRTSPVRATVPLPRRAPPSAPAAPAPAPAPAPPPAPAVAPAAPAPEPAPAPAAVPVVTQAPTRVLADTLAAVATVKSKATGSEGDAAGKEPKAERGDDVEPEDDDAAKPKHDEPPKPGPDPAAEPEHGHDAQQHDDGHGGDHGHDSRSSNTS